MVLRMRPATSIVVLVLLVIILAAFGVWLLTSGV
jgi:hypothetical protein